MSAVFTLKQSRSAHMIVDAAVYTASDFTLTNVNATKATALVTLPAIISCTGANQVQRLLAEAIEYEFSTFDDLIASGASFLQEEFSSIAEHRLNGDACSTLSLIGWHRKANTPGVYSIDLWTDGPERDRWIRNSASIPGFNASAMSREFRAECSNITGSPMPDVSRFRDRCFEVRAPDDYRPEIDLSHIIEMARQTAIGGNLAVGGKAVLSTIDERGVRQRVVREWSEDRVGYQIDPIEPNWRSFREDLERQSIRENIPELSGLSRLQRERMEKKARKGTLRSVS